MTTMTLDNPKIEEKYSPYEMRLKFLDFLESITNSDFGVRFMIESSRYFT